MTSIFHLSARLQDSVRLLAMLLVISLVGCNTTKKVSVEGADLERLAGLMTGAFNSAEQARQDSAFFDVSLHMTPIWPQRNTAAAGYWLYIEQAMTARLEQPYRQRIYRVEQVDAQTFKSNVYLIPEEKKFIGAWRDIARFEALSPEQLELKEGCAVFLTKNKDGSYSGSTMGKGCESNLRGASYATSEVRIDGKGIQSWDRGFDSKDQQVWGAVKGGYIFNRVNR